jgi:hypothetical protein
MICERLAPGRPRSPDTMEILELRKKGWTYGQINSYLGVPRSTISTICQRDHECVICSPFPCIGRHKHDNKTQKIS